MATETLLHIFQQIYDPPTYPVKSFVSNLSNAYCFYFRNEILWAFFDIGFHTQKHHFLLRGNSFKMTEIFGKLH